MIQIAHLLFLVNCLLVVSKASAKSEPYELSDSLSPIQIVSNSAEFDDKTGHAVYKGNVVMDQGTRHLTSDTLILKRDPNNKISLMIATGKPAQFQAKPNSIKPTGYGKANIVKYYPLENKIVLIENAELTQDNDVIHGPHLTYDLTERTLVSTPINKKRTTVILQQKASHVNPAHR